MNCFYEEGLQFSCQEGCYYCCGVEPGFVFLSLDDLKRLAIYLKIDEQAVVKTYCRPVNMGSFSYISLKEVANHDCIFLEREKGCQVYQSRPVQCATYPFWASILESRETWHQEKQWCPGIDKGCLHSKEFIENELVKRRGINLAVWEEFVQ
ncbi:MAG: YkgJ family cysteine cluster protein [Sphaerochaetaceae bacterium]|jgi:Fe-S-cluster containining protein